MKRELGSIARITSASVLVAFVGACVPPESASATKSISLDQWAASYIDKGEKLLCKREENGEYFFLAQEVVGNRVKVGSLIDMSSYRHLPHAFIVAWKFRNEKGGHLVVGDAPPSAVQEAYVTDSGKTYAENVQYQTLYLRESKEMRVTVDVKKCPTADCETQKMKSKDEKEYSVRLCEVPLKS